MNKSLTAFIQPATIKAPSTTSQIIMEALIALAFSVIMAIPGAIWQGFILSKLWLWFIVPVFALAPIAIVPAIGLMLVVGFLTHQTPIGLGDRSYSEVLAHEFSAQFISPTVFFLFALVVHQFM